jgi:hypothetical protein
VITIDATTGSIILTDGTKTITIALTNLSQSAASIQETPFCEDGDERAIDTLRSEVYDP